VLFISDHCFVDIGTIGPVEEIAVDNSSQGKVGLSCISVFVCRIRLNIAIVITLHYC